MERYSVTSQLSSTYSAHHAQHIGTYKPFRYIEDTYTIRDDQRCKLSRISCYSKGITVFKFFIWGGISSDIRSEILFYGDASAEP